jgi:hypothetical protein
MVIILYNIELTGLLDSILCNSGYNAIDGHNGVLSSYIETALGLVSE